jgi:adenylate kinase family enzyme
MNTVNHAGKFVCFTAWFSYKQFVESCGEVMKIRIIGPSGSGKTFLAKRLSEKYHIPVCSLDDLFWDNSKGAYNCKRDENSRDAMLEQKVSQEDWIIEGVQFTWCESSFAHADVIYFLDTPPLLCRVRIIRRFLKRKFHRTSRKNETLSSLVSLLKWTKKFYHVNLPQIRSTLSKYENKVVTLPHKQDIQHLISR